MSCMPASAIRPLSTSDLAKWQCIDLAQCPFQDQFEDEMQTFLGGEDCPVFNNLYQYCQVNNSRATQADQAPYTSQLDTPVH